MWRSFHLRKCLGRSRLKMWSRNSSLLTSRPRPLALTVAYSQYLQAIHRQLGEYGWSGGQKTQDGVLELVIAHQLPEAPPQTPGCKECSVSRLGPRMHQSLEAA